MKRFTFLERKQGKIYFYDHYEGCIRQTGSKHVWRKIRDWQLEDKHDVERQFALDEYTDVIKSIPR